MLNQAQHDSKETVFMCHPEFTSGLGLARDKSNQLNRPNKLNEPNKPK